MHVSNRSRRDVVVVGARVAGASTAMLLARLGHDVVVVDQASFPSDAVSTHSIARSGVVQLRRWGLLGPVLASGAPALRQVTFHAGGASVSRTIKHKAGVDLVVAPRRYVLDTIIAAAARQAGADVRTGGTVTGVQRDGRGRVMGINGYDRAGAPVDLRGRYVIGADGLRSQVARSARAGISQRRLPGGAAQYAYYAGIPWAGMELSWPSGRSPGCSRPTTRGRASGFARPPLTPRRPAVGLPHARRPSANCSGVPPPGWSSDCGAFRPRAGRATARRPPDLAGAGHAAPAQPGAPRIRPGLGAGRGCRLSPRRRHPHGISDAFRDAEFLAVALDQALSDVEESTALARYQQQRDQALRDIFDITCRLAAYPAAPAFIELQKQLSAAIDNEAAALAARPVPGECHRATA